MSTRPIGSKPSRSVPAEYSGKWIAWSADHSQIVAHGDKLDELWKAVKSQQVIDPIFEKVPRADVRFVGMR